MAIFKKQTTEIVVRDLNIFRENLDLCLQFINFFSLLQAVAILSTYLLHILPHKIMKYRIKM